MDFSDAGAPLLARDVSAIQLLTPSDPLYVSMLTPAVDLSAVPVALGPVGLAWDPIAAPSAAEKARLKQSAITGTEDDHLRSALAQARMRLESLNMLSHFVSGTVALRVIDQVLTKFRAKFNFDLGDTRPVTIDIVRLRQCRDLPKYVDGLIREECRFEAERQAVAGQDRIDAFPKPTVLLAWWRQRKNYLLKSGQDPNTAGSAAIRDQAQLLYMCENAAIFNGAELVSYKPEFSTDRDRCLTVTERVVDLGAGKMAVISNYFPVTPGWLLPGQIDVFVEIYEALEIVLPVTPAKIRAALAAVDLSAFPAFFIALSGPEQMILVRALFTIHQDAVVETGVDGEAKDDEEAQLAAAFRRRIEQFLATPPATLRHIWVRAQAGMHEVRVYGPATADDGVRPCLYHERWMRDGSYPAAGYGHFHAPEDYLAQLLSSVVQSFEINLHVYVADMMERIGRADILAQVALHPHISLTSLLSPTVEDCILRCLTCGAFSDDNSRMVTELRKVVLVLQQVVIGSITLPADYADGYSIDGVPISEPMFDKLRSLYAANQRGIKVNGVKLHPTVDFNNFTVNEFRQEHWFWKRVKLSGSVTGFARLDTSTAEQPVGCRASVIGFANALGDFLALNKVHDLGDRFLTDYHQTVLQGIQARIMRLMTNYADDIRNISITELQSLDRTIEYLRGNFSAAQRAHPMVDKLRMGLQAASRYLMTINNHVGRNSDLNRGLMAASFERIMEKTLGDCKSSADRYSLQEANLDAMVLRYREADNLPMYSNYYGPFYSTLVNRGADFDFKQDKRVFLDRFVDCSLHQFRVRHLIGAAAGTGIKSLGRIIHPASKALFEARGIDFSEVQKTASFVKIKEATWPVTLPVLVIANTNQQADIGIDLEAAAAVPAVVVPYDATQLARQDLGMRVFLAHVDTLIDDLRAALSGAHDALLGTIAGNIPGFPRARLADVDLVCRVLLPKPSDFFVGADRGGVLSGVVAQMRGEGASFDRLLVNLKVPAHFAKLYQQMMFVYAPVEFKAYFCPDKYAEQWRIWQTEIEPRKADLLGVVMFGRMSSRTGILSQIWRNKGRVVAYAVVSAAVGYGLSVGFATGGDWLDRRNFASAGMMAAEGLGLLVLKAVRPTVTSFFAFRAYVNARDRLPQFLRRNDELAGRVARDFLDHNTGDRDVARAIVLEAGRSNCAQCCDSSMQCASTFLKGLMAFAVLPVAAAAAIWLFFSVLFSCLGEPENASDRTLFDLGTAGFCLAVGYTLYQGRGAFKHVKNAAEKQGRIAATHVPFEPIM